jgi:hypothetical protein
VNAPKRLLDSAHTQAEQVIATAASVEPRALDRGTWDEITQRALSRRPSMLQLVPAFAVSALVGVVLVLALRPQVPPSPTPRAAELVTTAGARWALLSAEEVSLESGRLTVLRANGSRLRIRTPDAVLESANARFLAEVFGATTSITVEEGEVVVRTEAGSRTLVAKEALRWTSAPVIPATLVAGAPSADGACHGLENDAQRRCLEAEASGDSLEAQAALYELASLQVRTGESESAVVVLRQSLERFPSGVLDPEVRVALTLELVKLERYPEAQRAARDFTRLYPSDPRVLDVEALARSLQGR